MSLLLSEVPPPAALGMGGKRWCIKGRLDALMKGIFMLMIIMVKSWFRRHVIIVDEGVQEGGKDTMINIINIMIIIIIFIMFVDVVCHIIIVMIW